MTPFPMTKTLITAAVLAVAVSAFTAPAGAQSDFKGSPDAIDRALAAQQADRMAALDARERSQLTRPESGIAVGAADAFERAVAVGHAGSTPPILATLDARERSMATRPPIAPTSPEATRFGWDHFAMGAGAAIGVVLVLVGVAAFASRRIHDRVSTA